MNKLIFSIYTFLLPYISLILLCCLPILIIKYENIIISFLKGLKMNLNSEIYKYISKTFLFSTGIIILLFASIIFLLVMPLNLEKNYLLMKKISTTLILILSSLNLPKMLLEILPFCFFFSGMLWVIKVSSTKELVVMRTTGLTIRKITLPIFFGFYYSRLIFCSNF